MWTRYAAVWFVFLFLAIVNGTVRDFVYKPWVGEHRSQQVSVVIAILLFAAVMVLAHKRWAFESAGQAWTVGVAWMLATVAFEIVLVRWIGGKPWSAVRAHYDLLSGNLWVLVLVALLVLPTLVRKCVG